MRKLILPIMAFALILGAGSASAMVPGGCDDEFRQIDEDLAVATMKSEDKHDVMSAALGAYQRCRAGDADAFDDM